jgi:probable HAF family extracellular repeat protein
LANDETDPSQRPKEAEMKHLFVLASPLAIAAVLAFGGIVSAAAPSFAALTLPNLTGGLSSSAAAVNDAGQIVGWATTAAGDQHAVAWQDGAIADLGTLPGDTSSYATAISGSGLIVGVSGVGALAPFDPGNENAHAVLWQDGETIDLGTLPGGAYSVATGVNDAGQVVGYSRTYVPALGGAAIHGFLWQNGQMADLPPLQPSSAVLSSTSAASGINIEGQIVGNSASFDSVTNVLTRHAVTWQDGVITDLAAFAGDPTSVAVAINDPGQIVGASGDIDPDLAIHAVRWSGRQIKSLARPAGERFSSGLALNQHGVVVGQCAIESGVYGCRWKGNTVSILLPRSGDVGSTAFGVNSGGLAVGISQDASSFRAVVWKI